MTDTTDNRPYHHGDLKAALIAAAEAELSEAGLEGFSLRACARRAGVSHTAPKHHFGSADGLLAAVAARGFHGLAARIDESIAETPAKPDRLVSAGHGYVVFAEAHPTVFKLMFSEWARKQTDPDLQASRTAAFERLQEAVFHAQHEAGPEEAGIGNLMAWAVVHGLSHLLIEGSDALVTAADKTGKSEMIDRILRRAVEQAE